MSEVAAKEPCDINQSYANLIGQLTEHWRLIGLNADEQVAEEEKLLEHFDSFLKERWEASQHVVDEMEAALVNCQSEITAICTTMGIDAEVLDLSGFATLREKKAFADERLAFHTEARDTQFAHVEKSFAQLQCQFTDLDMQADEQGEFAALGSDLSIAFHQRMKAKIAEVSVEKAKRVKAIEQYAQQVRALMKELAMEGETDFERAIVNMQEHSLGVAKGTLETFGEKVDELKAETAKREERIKSLAATITELWDLLHASQEERNAFFHKFNNIGKYSMSVVNACEELVATLRVEKQARLPKLVKEREADLRNKAAYLCMSDEECRVTLPPPTLEGVGSQETLDALDKVFARLVEEEAKRAELLPLVHKREKIKKTRAEFIQMTADPARLSDRHYDVHRENHMRDALEKKLPSVSKKLRKLIPAWESQHDDLFLVNGQRYLSIMESEERMWEREAEERRAAYKAARGDRTPRAPQPSPRPGGRTRSVKSGRTKRMRPAAENEGNNATAAAAVVVEKKKKNKSAKSGKSKPPKAPKTPR